MNIVQYEYCLGCKNVSLQCHCLHNKHHRFSSAKDIQIVLSMFYPVDASFFGVSQPHRQTTADI